MHSKFGTIVTSVWENVPFVGLFIVNGYPILLYVATHFTDSQRWFTPLLFLLFSCCPSDVLRIIYDIEQTLNTQK